MRLRYNSIGFLVLMALDTTAHVFFKLAANRAAPLEADLDWALRLFGAPWVYGAVACYIATFFVWMTLLRHAPIGPAFAASHLEVLGVLVASVWVFDETVSARQLGGAALIVAGIVCLAFSESREAAPAEAAEAADAASPRHP